MFDYEVTVFLSQPLSDEIVAPLQLELLEAWEANLLYDGHDEENSYMKTWGENIHEALYLAQEVVNWVTKFIGVQGVEIKPEEE